MNAVATIRKPTRLELFMGEVLPADQRDDFYRVLPRHISPDRFERALFNALMNTPDLMAADPRLIFREVSKVVGLGLSLDPQLGEAYLILGWNAKSRQKEPQVRIGYKGLIKLAKQSGEILNIYAREVHEKDEIECIQGDENRLIHKPQLFTDRGPVVGYYAVVKYKSGEIDFEPMSVQQIHAIRDRSDAWKAFADGKIKSTPWHTDDGEMSKKTVFRRLTKRISQSADLNAAISIEDSADFSAFDKAARNDNPPPAPRREVARQPERAVIEHRPAEDAGAPDHVVKAERAAIDAVQEHDADGVVSMESLLTELDERLGYAKTADDVEEAYTDFDAEPIFSDYEGGVQAARALKAKHLDRVPAPKAEKPAPVADDGFPGDEAIEKLRSEQLERFVSRDPFTIPEKFKGGGHYQIWIGDACKSAKTQEHEDRLRLIWAQTKPQRDELAEAGQLDKVTVKILLDGLKEVFDRIQSADAEQPADALPPPAPRAQQPQQPRKAAESDEAPPPAPKAATGDPAAEYGARMEAAFVAAKTKEDVDKFWFGTVAERDAMGGGDPKWNIARSKAKNALPSEEA